MITISADQLRTLWILFKRFLELRGNQYQTLLHCQATADGIRFRAAERNQMAEFRLDGSFPDWGFVFPLRTLADFPKSQSVPITIQPTNGNVQFSWEQKGIPRSVTVKTADADGVKFPPSPQHWQPQPPAFRQGLKDVIQSTASEPTRYTLNCIQLRGQAGQLVGTDGVQLLVQSGFDFPFEDDLLVPASKVFSVGRELDSSVPLELGECPEHLAIRSGAWTCWLPLDKQARFPAVDSLIPVPNTSTCRVSLPESDRQFLRNALNLSFV